MAIPFIRIGCLLVAFALVPSAQGGLNPTFFALNNSSPVTCASLKSGGDNTSGIKTLNPNGKNSLQAYCDMTTDGGGWMLVARSVSGGSGSFGWMLETGSVSNDSSPYSMGNALSNFTWSAVLFGVYSSGKTWGSYVYKHSNIPSTFLSETGKWYNPANQTFGTNTNCGTYTPTLYPTAVIGGNSAFTMAWTLGYPDNTDHYFLRDCPGNAIYGLYPGQWNTGYAGAQGGNINGTQGMIMVR